MSSSIDSLMRRRVIALCGAAVGALLSMGGVVAEPASSPEVVIEQEALRTALPRLGALYGVKLRAGRNLAEQRVTLLGKGRALSDWKSALVNLLSHGEDGKVFWSRQGTVQILEDSHKRAILAAALASAERDSETLEIRQRIQGSLKQAAEFPDNTKLSGKERGEALDRFAGLLLLNAVGEDGLAKMRAGEPVVMSGDAIRAAPHGEMVDEWLSWGQSKPFADSILTLTADYLGSGVQIRTRFTCTKSGPTGGVGSRGSLGGGTERPILWGIRDGAIFGAQKTPTGGEYLSAYFLADAGNASPLGFDLTTPAPDEDKALPAVTLNLSPSESKVDVAPAPLSASLRLPMLLRRLYRASGIPIVADGYLRPPLYLKPNLEVQKVPVDRLLHRVAMRVDANSRSIRTEAGPILLLRAQRWWSEDLCNVPQAKVDEIARRLPGLKPPTLEDLIPLCALSERQIYRLVVEADLAPGGNGVFRTPSGSGNGAQYFIRAYAALPPHIRPRVFAGRGVPLDDYPLALQAATPGLIRFGGVHRAELLRGLWLSVKQRASKLQDGRARWSYEFWIMTDERGSGISYAFPLTGQSRLPEPARDAYGELLPTAAAAGGTSNLRERVSTAVGETSSP